jgi:hypothetical protein
MSRQRRVVWAVKSERLKRYLTRSWHPFNSKRLGLNRSTRLWYQLKGSWCRLEGGWIGESWKSPLTINLSVNPGYSGLFFGVSGKSGISGKISEISGLAPSQRNQHTAQNRCHRFWKSGATGFAWQWLPSSSPPCLLVWLELKLGVWLKDQFLDEYRVPALHKH